MADDYVSRKRVAVPTSVANAAVPTYSEGQFVPSSTDLSGVGRVRMDAKTDANGLSIARLISAAGTTNATVVKASAGRMYKIRGYNAAAAVRYIKLYDKATAPTVGTDTPVATITLKASDAFDIDLMPYGQSFTAGISYATTTGSADADTAALTAADIVGMCVWYA